MTAGILEAGDVAVVLAKLKDGRPSICRIGWDDKTARFTGPPNEYERDGYYDQFDGGM